MLLANKNAVIYGAGGAIGAAVAHAFAREGANVFLTGRNLAALEVAAKEITAADRTAETAAVDALDEQAVERHADAVVARAGSLDISFNAIESPRKASRAPRWWSCRPRASASRSPPTPPPTS
jgi:NAD(P)-dependent dehydrogenase (short-subunit alcohol dehydrogenase family)